MVPGEFVELAAHVAEMAGVVVIVGGLVVATVRALVAGRLDAATRYTRGRRDLARAILLGLEVLVAADIVRSVALAPTVSGLSVLAMLVAIRSFLSWSLSLEIEGRWPWQRAHERDPLSDTPAAAMAPGQPHR